MISDIVFFLLKKGAHLEPRRITTGEVAEGIGVSQQTASRKLIQLEKEGQISRSQGRIALTQNAILEIKSKLKEILNSLDGTTITFKGKVASGLGEGAYYMRQKHYVKEFNSKLCFKPFPGTLNVSIGEDDIEKRLVLREQKPIVISGFTAKSRSFGRIDAYRCSISGLPGAIIFPERSLHGLQTLEIISPFNLRKKLLLSDGSDVKIEVVKNNPCEPKA
ncbi:MAG: CTP-dependent riboflavin kinase [Candidatus Micrarchaeota archaeon]|nr:CTP-dependent riboflavin kinase [Candidatus Micrarchaeota archaeon]